MGTDYAMDAWCQQRIEENAMVSDDSNYGSLRGDSPLFLSRKGKQWRKLSFNDKKYEALIEVIMNPQALLRRNLYEELISLPESLTGEILNSQLYAHPRPSGQHVLVAYNIGIEIGGPYYRGKGGPGGWWILQEPEVHFIMDEQVAVPDVAGWRKERMPTVPESHKFSVVPDWICEVLSPSTESVDREIKMPLYAQFGVNYLWLVHPKKKTLETYKLNNSSWESQGTFSGNDIVCVKPFDSIKIGLGELLG